MSTKKLARELGIIRKRTSSSSSLTHTKSVSNQLFSYLIIIDFESTCWREKNNHGQEIIEFPAVLMNTHTGQIESEFHSYVQPQEHPRLSSFCTELTGITQEQVEAGLPLHICLSRFTRWLHTLQRERDVVFLTENTHTHTAASGKACTFLTWSDWDLGVCLQYECKRKQITKPDVLNCWIDLRATYKIFYHRKPKGLNGALQDLGIEFSGREHSGLDDAKNTARLAWRMIRDGCMMRITKSLCRAPVMAGAPVRGVCADGGVCNKRKEKQLTHPSDTHTRLHAVTSSHTSVCQNLVSVRTVLSSITTPLHTLSVTHTTHPDMPVTHTTHTTHPDTPVTHTTHTTHPDMPVTHTTHPDMPVTHTTHTTHPDTSVTHTTHPDTPVTHTTCITHTSLPDTTDWPDEFVLIEFGESGSYDDVILEDSDLFENTLHNPASTVCKEKPRPLKPIPSCSQSIRSLKGLGSRSAPTIPFSIFTDQSHHSSPSSSPSSSSSTVFRVSSSILSSTVNQSALPSVNQPHRSISLNQSALSDLSVNQSAHASFSMNQTRLSRSIKQSLHSFCKQLPLPPPRGGSNFPSSFTNKSAFSSVSINQSCLSTLSANQSAFSTSSSKRLPLPPSRGGVKITSPLCDCGRRSKRLTVCNGGPNHGRAFYTCAGRRSSGPVPEKKGCGFFKWESSLIKSAVNRNTSALSFNLSTAASRNLR